jgi:outer membrane protein OmpA-like peptidoglycan-associated protein
MKLLSTLILVVFSITSLSAQDAETNMVTLDASVTDMKDNPRNGEQIIFENIKTGKEYRAVSNQQGKLTTQLPAPATYKIKVKGIGSELDYNTIEFPPLKENQMYGVFELFIKFDPPRTFTLDNVYFDTGKSTIKHASAAELNELKEYLELKPSVKIEIGGHTDDVGSDEDNMQLSQDRAEAVRNWLVRRGIDGDRIKAKGYGETRPVASNQTAEGRQKNRRTQVRILSE